MSFQQPDGARVVIAAERRLNGHEYRIGHDIGTASVFAACTCRWTGTPWRPEQGSPARIDQAAREWHAAHGHTEEAAS